jgi:hypothetical protein
MFLLSPEFFCTCLNLNLEKAGRVQMARVVNRGEACVRKWQRDNCYPPEAVDKLIEFLGSIGSGEIKTEIDVAMEEPFRATTDVYKWRMFCQGLLANEDAFLPDTFGEILSYSGQWLDVMSSIRKLEKVRQFDFYKKQLLSIESTRLNLPVSCQNQITDAKNWESLRPAITWLFVENFIYFLALAEVECLWLYHRIKEPKISRIVLPRLKKGTVQYPVKLFFGYFFDNLVTKGFHRSLGSIAGKIPRVLPLDKAGKESGKSRSRIDEDSGWREIKRAKYQGKAPAFETFKAWIDALIPSDIHSSPEELELEKQLLCDALGAARIIDRFFKDVSQNIPEKELLVRFESYDIWHRFHRTAIVDDV